MIRVASLLALFIVPLASAFELNGTVVDTEGRPVAGADVWVVQGRRVQKAETAPDGAFVFSGLDVERVEVVARKEGYALGGLDARGLVDSGSVTLRLGHPEKVRIRVLDHEFRPVAGARIKTIFVGDGFTVSVEDLVSRGFPSIRSDEQGRLDIPALPEGKSVNFVIQHPKYAETFVARFPVGADEQSFVLYPGVRVRGRVTTQEKEGVARARVSVFRHDGVDQWEVAEVLTDPEGFYTAAIRPGDYHVAVKHPDYASPAPKPLSLRHGDEDHVVDLVLLTACSIEGKVVGPDGKPMPGVKVGYVDQQGLYLETITEHDGTFSHQVAGGEGVLRVIPPDGLMNAELGDITVNAADTPHIRLDNPIKLIPLPEIVGTVFGPDNQSEPNVLVSSLDLDPAHWVITDETGRFRIQLPRLPLEAKAAFRAEHASRFLRKDFQVKFRKLKPVEVTLEPFEPDLRPCDSKRAGNELAHMVGDPAPAIECDAWFNTDPLALEDLRGKVVVLTLWGGFDVQNSGRRIEELRALFDLFRNAAMDDVVIIAVHEASIQPDRVKEYVEEYGIEFPAGRDVQLCVTLDSYNTNFIPQTVLIDKEGRIRYFDVAGRLLELIKSLRREAQ